MGFHGLFQQLKELIRPHRPPRDAFENAVYCHQQSLIVHVGIIMGSVILLNSTLVALLFITTAPYWKLAIWLLPNWAYGGFLVLSMGNLAKRPPPVKTSGRLLNAAEWGGLFVGGYFGFAYTLFADGNQTAELFLMALTAGMGAGVCAVMNTLPRFCFRFLIGSSLPLIGHTIFIDAGLIELRADGSASYSLIFASLSIVLFIALMAGVIQNYKRLLVLIKATQDSREAREYLMNALESTNDAFVIMTGEGEVRVANNNHKKWFSESDEWKNRQNQSFEVSSGRIVQQRRYQIQNGDIVIVHTDITDLHEKNIDLDRARQEAEVADEAKSRFLSTLSHELRTPLNIIIGFSSLMDENSKVQTSYEEMRSNSTRIHQAGRELLKLIENMLEYSRIGQSDFHEDASYVAVQDITKEVLKDLANSDSQMDHRDISLSFQKATSDINIREDHAKKIIGELLLNASKFRGDTDKRIILRCGFMDDGKLVFSVTDFGIGISEKDLNNIFEPFFQSGRLHNSTHEGTGIGLTLCRHLARVGGGDLKVRSKPGQGTTAYWIVGENAMEQENYKSWLTGPLAV